MKKYNKKKEIKSEGFFSRIFNLFYDMFGGEKIAKSFKSVVLAFHGKSNKQIKEHFEMEKLVKEMKMKEAAQKQIEEEKNNTM